MPLSRHGELVKALIGRIIVKPVGPNQSINVDPAANPDLATVNRILYGRTTGPLTPANVNSTQSLGLSFGSPPGGWGSNIRDLGGANMAASGFWRFVATISAGARSKTSSIVYGSGSADQASAVLKAYEWANKLAGTLGRYEVVGVDVPAPTAASPQIMFIRVTDARQPRIGQLLRTGGGQSWGGFASGVAPGNYSADFMSTALALRMQAQVAPGGQVGYANHALYGVPDAVVVKGDQIDFSPVDAANVALFVGSYAPKVKAYIDYICNPVNKLGCMVINQALWGSVADPTHKVQTGPFALTGGRWSFLPGATGWLRGDRIRLVGCNAPGFNGSYEIDVDATGLIVSLTSGPPTTVAAPTKGQAYRYQKADGTKINTFAQYVQLAAQVAAPFGLFVSKRNPARPFFGVSFRKKTRRLH